MACRCSWWFAATLGLVLLGCTSVAIEDDGDTVAEPEPSPDDPLPDWTGACPAPAGLEELEPSLIGSCSNQPAEGSLTLQNAEDILYRVVHEAGHMSSAMTATDDGLFTWTYDGGEMLATTDDGFAIGLVTDRPTADSEACAVVELRCWTGGHGGWGPSALAGVAFMEVTVEAGEVTHVRVASDAMWLVEAQPLSGTPRTTVSVGMSIAQGEVVQLDAHVGEHHIVR